MDDDAFLHAPHFAELLPKMEPLLNASKFFAEMCGEVGNVAFPCGGGGMLVP
jgi:hypothetical protein